MSCGMWDLVPWLGLKPRPPALEAQSLSPWTTREVSCKAFLIPFKLFRIFQIVVKHLCSRDPPLLHASLSAHHQSPLQNPSPSTALSASLLPRYSADSLGHYCYHPPPHLFKPIKWVAGLTANLQHFLFQWWLPAFPRMRPSFFFFLISIKSFMRSSFMILVVLLKTKLFIKRDYKFNIS